HRPGPRGEGTEDRNARAGRCLRRDGTSGRIPSFRDSSGRRADHRARDPALALPRDPREPPTDRSCATADADTSDPQRGGQIAGGRPALERGRKGEAPWATSNATRTSSARSNSSGSTKSSTSSISTSLRTIIRDRKSVV